MQPPTGGTCRNISTIILYGRTRTGESFEAALDAFSDKSNHNPNPRPVHYSYEKFRDWAEATVQVPRDKPICIVVQTPSSIAAKIVVSTEMDFTTVLTKLWIGSIKPVVLKQVGEVVPVSEVQQTVPPVSQPAAEAKQPEKPEPEKVPAPTPNEDNDLQPLSAAEFLELVRIAKNHDDPCLTRAEIDEPDADSRLYKFHPRILKKALIFFNTNIDEDEKCKVQGIKEPLHIWQINDAYRMFMNPITEGVNGLCIGDDVGYGKTRLILLYLRARAQLLDLKKEVDDEWKGKQPHRHLRKTRKRQKECCPSQGSFMVQCPCSMDSDTWDIFDYMANLPALVIGPPNLRDTWMQEMEKTFPDFGEEDQVLQPFYLYGGPTPGKDLHDPGQQGEIVESTKGEWLQDLNSLDVGKGTAHDLFLCSPMMPQKLLDKFKPENGKKSLAAFGVVIMDEVQNWKGSEKTETLPFLAVKSIADISYNPLTLFTLCGTTVEEGPGVVRAASIHFREQWESFGDCEQPILMIKSGVLPTVLTKNPDFPKFHRQLVRGHADDSMSAAETKQKTDAIRAHLKPFVICLRQGQIWRGKPLNLLPELNASSVKLNPIDDVETQKARKMLVANIQKVINEELSKKQADWKYRKSQALKKGITFHEDEPTKLDVIEGQVNAEKMDQAWLTLARASSYPYCTVLQQKSKKLKQLQQERAEKGLEVSEEEGVVPLDMFDAKDSQMIPVQVHQNLERTLGKRHADVSEFNEWDFYAHAEKLKDNSPKLQRLRSLIDNMVKDNDPATEPENDPCKKRHAIVFHTHTISAVLTYFYLITDEELCKKIQPILFTSGIDLPKRQKIMKKMNQPGNPDDRCKVLIAVTKLAAEGYNLQRVNNLWFMETPTALTRYLQAIGRAYRTGQKMKVNIVRMVDNENLLETTSMRTLMSKKKVSDLIHNVKIMGDNA